MTDGQAKLEADLRSGVAAREAVMRRSVEDLGPFIVYPAGEVCDRRTGTILWRPGDPPEKRPRNPGRGESEKPHNSGYFGGWR